MNLNDLSNRKNHYGSLAPNNDLFQRNNNSYNNNNYFEKLVNRHVSSSDVSSFLKRMEKQQETDTPEGSEERGLQKDKHDDIKSVARSARQKQENVSLVSSMASRLKNLEASRIEMRKKFVEMEKQVVSLKRENQVLGGTESLKIENEQLRRELADIKQFLADYGLTWVGEKKQATNHSFSRKVDIFEGNKQQQEEERNTNVGKLPLLLGTFLANDNVVDDHVSGVDSTEVVRKLEELNNSVSETTDMKTSGGRGGIHSFSFRERIPICVYKDGLMIRSGPFRKFEYCMEFLDDIFDGYFPGEFRNEFPEGVFFDVQDRHDEKYDIKKNNKIRKPIDIARKVPKYVIKEGKITRPQQALLGQLCPPPSSQRRNYYSKREILITEKRKTMLDRNFQVTIIVYLNDHEKVEIHATKEDSIDTLRELILKQTSISGNFHFKSAVQGYMKSYEPTPFLTVEQCGWFPNAVVYIKKHI